MAHGADGARDLGGVGDAAEDGGDHVAVFEGGGEAGALFGVVAEPVEELGEAPFGGVDAAAPVDGFERGGAGGGGDLGGFLPGAVVAPEVVVVQRSEAVVDGDDGGAGGVEGEGFDILAGDTGGFQGALGREGEGGHVVGVRLGRMVGVFFFAVEGVVCGARSYAAFFAVEEGDSYAQGSEVYSGYFAHGSSGKT